MEISYLGKTSIKVKGKVATLVTDPEKLKTPTDIITISKGNNPEPMEGAKIINGPGEYEIKEVSIIGIDAGENTIYRIDVDGMTLLHIGEIENKLTESQLKEIGEVDIAFVLATEELPNIVRQINPSVIIPMNYVEGDASVAKMGLTVEKLPKLTLKAGDLAAEDQKIVVLENK